MFRFLETIKVKNGEVQNLNYHQQRLSKTLKEHYSVYSEFILGDLINVPEEFLFGISKCRFVYNSNSYDIKFNIYNHRKIESLKIVMCDNIDYNYKYFNRELLNSLLKYKDGCDDILIIKNGLITDISFANICFYNGKNWYTPSTPLLKGTCREKLLKQNSIIEKEIGISDLDYFSHFTIINAMRGEELSELIPVKKIF